MEQWIESRNNKPDLSILDEEPKKSNKVTEEDKEYLKEKFRSILSHYNIN